MKPSRYTREAAWFVWRHYPPAKDWGRHLLQRWITWNCSHGFMLTVLGNEEQLLGLAVVRPMMRENCYDERKSNHFDEEGDTYFVDLGIALQPRLQVLQALGFAGLKRFGQRDYIAFQVRGGDVKIVDARQHRARMFKQRKAECSH